MIFAAASAAPVGDWVGTQSSQASVVDPRRAVHRLEGRVGEVGELVDGLELCAARGERGLDVAVVAGRRCPRRRREAALADRCVVEVAWGPGFQTTRASGRPEVAAQKLVATTATPFGISTTARTPSTARASRASKDATAPPRSGGRTTCATSMPGTRTSRPKIAEPSTLAGVSSRRTSVRSGGSPPAPSAPARPAAGAPLRARRASRRRGGDPSPAWTTRPSRRGIPSGRRSHRSQAAATSSSRAVAPARR